MMMFYQADFCKLSVKITYRKSFLYHFWGKFCAPVINAADFLFYEASGKNYIPCYDKVAGLAVFNLIPISPLDGSKILAIVLPDKAYLWLMRYERYGMFLLMLLLFAGVLDVPLDFLRTGLLRGLSLLTHLPFPDPNILRQIF
jgi:hypothetical protein